MIVVWTKQQCKLLSVELEMVSLATAPPQIQTLAPHFLISHKHKQLFHRSATLHSIHSLAILHGVHIAAGRCGGCDFQKRDSPK
jgi:hypothetical protein